jgi:hypothetical protein
MTTDLNTISAVVIIVGGIIIFVLSVYLAGICAPRERWMNVFGALAGLMIVISFAMALANTLGGGAGLVMPEIGRPSVILIVFALAVRLVTVSRKGKC